MDGRVPDEGACIEVGYAYGIGKECFGIKTDTRVSELGTDNLMIGGALKLRVASSVGELLTLLSVHGFRSVPVPRGHGPDGQRQGIRGPGGQSHTLYPIPRYGDYETACAGQTW